MNLTNTPQVARWTAGTHARIDLGAYARNLARLRTYSPPEVKLLAVVKADAYGHGLAMCGLAAEAAGADWLGVARIQEALRLRNSGVSLPVLVLGPPNLHEIELAIAAKITLAIGSYTAVDRLVALAEGGSVARVHLKIDTGMRRYGFTSTEIADVALRLQAAGVVIDGVFTHFASADDLDPLPTTNAHAEFNAARDALRDVGIEPALVHAANSAALITDFAGDTNMVRSGIATYGLSPSPEVPVPSEFEPIAEVWSTAARCFTVRALQGVTYNYTWIAEVDTPAATVPIGYADGLPRGLQNQGWFVINGDVAPIIGRVCMDQTVAAVAGGVAEGTPVQIIGPAPAMSLATSGEMVGSNNYEAATRMMARMPRVYVVDNEAVGWEHLLLGEASYPAVGDLRTALEAVSLPTAVPAG